jgi:hypothetical protein
MQFLKRLKIHDLEFWIQRFHKSYTNAVDMATMTFQDGGYFGLENNFDEPEILFHKMNSIISILNYLDN